MTEEAVVRRDEPQAAEYLVPVTLVPVEVFGAGICDEHPCPACEAHAAYGLCDAVEPWSDCNRAEGRIYRVDDMPRRRDGETLTVWVTEEDRRWFDRTWPEATNTPTESAP